MTDQYDIPNFDLFPHKRIAFLENEIRRLKSKIDPHEDGVADLISRCNKQLQACLPYMQMGKDGVGPDCTGILQLIIDTGSLKEGNNDL